MVPAGIASVRLVLAATWRPGACEYGLRPRKYRPLTPPHGASREDERDPALARSPCPAAEPRADTRPWPVQDFGFLHRGRLLPSMGDALSQFDSVRPVSLGTRSGALSAQPGVPRVVRWAKTMGLGWQRGTVASVASHFPRCVKLEMVQRESSVDIRVAKRGIRPGKPGARRLSVGFSRPAVPGSFTALF